MNRKFLKYRVPVIIVVMRHHTFGLFLVQNAGSFYEWVPAGLTSVSIEGLNSGTLNLTHSKWSYKVIYLSCPLSGSHLDEHFNTNPMKSCSSECKESI